MWETIKVVLIIIISKKLNKWRYTPSKVKINQIGPSTLFHKPLISWPPVF